MPENSRRLVLVLALSITACDRAQEPADPVLPVAKRVVPLDSPAPPGAGEGNLLVARDGSLLMSWIEEDAGTARLNMARWDGVSWDATRLIAQGSNWFVNWADFPALSEDRVGGLYAHWLEREGESTYAYGVRLVHSGDGGVNWSPAVRPHDDPHGTEHGFVSHFQHADGTPGLAWLDGRQTAGGHGDGHGHGGAMTLRAGRIQGDQVLDQVLDNSTCDCCQTDAVWTPDGPVVVYRDRDADEIRDIAMVRFAQEQWQPPEQVAEDGWQIAACPVNGPAISASDHALAVAWFTMAGGQAAVKLALAPDAATGFGPPIRIDQGQPLGRVDVAFLGSNDLVVSWLDADGDEARVQLARVQEGIVTETMTVGRTSSARSSGFPRLAVVRGETVVLWREVHPQGAGLRLVRVQLESQSESES